MDFVRYMPVVGFVPLTIVWLGVDDAQKFAIVFIGTFFQEVLLVMDNVKRTPKELVDIGRTLGLRDRGLLASIVLRAASWRNAGDPSRALTDAQFALRIAPEHSEALLERGFSYLALGDKKGAEMDFSKVLVLVPPGSDAARRAEAGLRGEQPSAATPAPAAKGGGTR